MKCTKKFIAVFMIMILVSSPVVTYAQTGTLTVSGGTWQGLGSRAASITLIMMVAQSLGFTWHISQTAVDAGETISEQVDKLIDRWLEDGAPIDVVNIIGGGSGGSSGNQNNDENKISPDGKVYISAGALYMIQKFFNWLKSKGFLNSGQVSSPGSEFQVNDTWYGLPCGPWKFSINPSEQGAYIKYNRYGAPSSTGTSCGVVALPVTGGYYAVMFVPADIIDRVSQYAYYGNETYFIGSNPIGGRYVNSHGINWAYTYLNFWKGLPDIVPSGVKVIENTGDIDQSIHNYLDTLTGFTPGIWGETVDETYLEGNYNSSDLDNSNGYYTEIDPNILQGLQSQLEDNTNATIGIQEYLKAIQNSLNQQAGDSAEEVHASDNSTLENIGVTVPQPSEYTYVLPLDQNDPVNVVTPPSSAEPIQDPNGTPDPEESVPRMMLPLDEYFPFCVPFDIYALFQKLQGTPEAPSYTFEFTEPFSGAHVVIPVDLSIFNDAMVTVRKVEVVLYIVCLAVASRKFYAR